MAYSGTVGNTTINTVKVVEKAFRRCKLRAQDIAAEMTDYALESLHLFLSELAAPKPPSWCIEKVVLPMYVNNPIVTLPIGTIDILNLNYRVIQAVTGQSTTTSTSYTVNFLSDTMVAVVGIRWAADSVPVSLSYSSDGLTWVTVYTADVSAVSGETSWFDVPAPSSAKYFRVLAVSGSLSFSWITFGNMPIEIPLGQLNRDSYVNQSNKVFPGRPSNFYFQRTVPRSVLNIWPAPFLAAEQAQLVLWRSRQIMDVANLRQEIEVPPRWLEAIVSGLAARVGSETPQVDPAIVKDLEIKAEIKLQEARSADNDGSSSYIQPDLSAYTA